VRRFCHATERPIVKAKIFARRQLAPGGIDMLRLIKEVFPSAFIFPMGAVAKPLEPDKGRPTDDHTRTGLNAATDMTGLSHTLNSYDEMARRFLPGYSAHVSDVEAAFPVLPFAPWVWPFMLHRLYRGEGPELSLFCHIRTAAASAKSPSCRRRTILTLPYMGCWSRAGTGRRRTMPRWPKPTADG
jgi:hypothetical protein